MSIVPAFDIQSSRRQRWDVVVIGAGPSGATAARLLALQGQSVLLVERKSFPRDKVCGACLNVRALSVLDQIGLSHVVQQSSAIKICDFSLSCRGDSIRLALPGGVAVSRSAFDLALVQEAVRCGVQFLPETAAAVLPMDREPCGSRRRSAVCRQVTLTCGGRPSERVTTDVVIAADGLGHSCLRSCPEFSSSIVTSSRVGLGTCLATPSANYPAGTIFMGVARAGYVGLVRVEDQRLNIAAAVDVSVLKSADAPGTVITQLMAEAGLPHVDELVETTWHGTVPLTRQSKTVAANRVFLIGDATGYVEPFTGEGMSGALSMGAGVVPFILHALTGFSVEAEQQWRRAQHLLTNRRSGWCRCFAWATRHPFVSTGLIRALTLFPRLSRPVVRQLNTPVNPMEIHFA